MSLEVPVLAPNVGGPPELVRDGREGYLVPLREPAAWAAGVRRIAENPAHASALGRAGRTRVVQSFGIHDHVTTVLGAYRRAAGRQGPAHQNGKTPAIGAPAQL